MLFNAPMLNMAEKELATREQAIALFSGELRKALESLPPEVTELTSQELELERKPQEVDYLLRKNLWKCVENAKNNNVSEVPAAHIYHRVCSRQCFEKILRHPTRLAWIMLPPREDKDRMRALLEIGLSQLEKLISQPVTEKNAGLILRTVELLMNRVHGPVIQRIQAQHAHVNLNKPIPPQINPSEDIQKRLSEIKNKLESVRDVTPSSEKPKDSA